MKSEASKQASRSMPNPNHRFSCSCYCCDTAFFFFFFLLRRLVLVLPLVVLVVVGGEGVSPRAADNDSSDSDSHSDSDHHDVYMVTLDGALPGIHKFQVLSADPTHSSTILGHSDEARAYFSQLEAAHDEFLSSFLEPGSYRKLYSYTHVLNGLAVQMSADKAGMMRNLPNVRTVEKDWRVEKLTTHTPEFLGLPNAVWPMEGGPGGAGEGIVIGIIDTGIDPSHPSFSVSGSMQYPPLSTFRGKCELPSFCNGKIVAAQHFAAAAQAAGAFNSSNDFASPLDSDGHGSHTASIAAGNHGVLVKFNGFSFGDASGMAPRARVSVYKALYRNFGGFVADIVAAIDQAAKDGVHILSLSVGPSNPPSTVPLTFLNAFDLALLSAVKAGVVVVQAAGNGGPYARTMASFSPWIISVAAGLDDRSYTNFVYLGNGMKLQGIGLAPATPGDGMYNLVLADDALLNNVGNSYIPNTCQDPAVFNTALVHGKILMCTYSLSFMYGGASVRNVFETARNLSAVGFILFARNDLPGDKFSPTPFAMPGIVVTDVKDSMILLSYYGSSKSSSQAKLGNGIVPTLQGTAPQVALFSSRGPCVKDYKLEDADVLKPNILAPGSLIWGAWTPIGAGEPDFQGQQFALMSGTSMATPHVGGVAALIRQKHPDWSPAAVASAMMTTASVVTNKGSQLLAQRYSNNGSVFIDLADPFDFGSGALDATAALDPGLVFEAGYEDYIQFLCAMSQADETQVMKATGSSCGGAKDGRAVDLNIPSITISNMLNTKTIKRTVTNVGGSTEAYTVSVTAPKGTTVQVMPSSFTVQAGGSEALTVTLKVVEGATGEYSFGAILLRGAKGHVARVPMAVRIGNG